MYTIRTSLLSGITIRLAIAASLTVTGMAVAGCTTGPKVDPIFRAVSPIQPTNCNPAWTNCARTSQRPSHPVRY